MRSLAKSTLKFSGLLLIILFLAAASLASTWYVDGVNGNDSNTCASRRNACKTIGHAISLASSGDTINLAAATYFENLTLTINLNIIGSGAAKTIVDGGQAGSVFAIPTPTVVLSNLTIRNGNAQFGGGVDNYGTVTINKSIITGNVSSDMGGGAFNMGTLTINNSTFSGNSDSAEYGEGGGILNFGTLTINNSTFSANTANGGAGVASSGALAISGSTFSGNIAGNGSGGAILEFGGTGTINNSTITANTSASNGGAILNYGTLAISNATIVGNSAIVGGGISEMTAYNGWVTFQNSLIANNSGGNCLSTMTSSGYNLSDDNTCNFTGTGDMNNIAPNLGTLGIHGGPTQTIPELPKSPTVDAGNPNGCTDGNGNLLTTDQRGFPRPGADKLDKRCDIGAFELQKD